MTLLRAERCIHGQSVYFAPLFTPTTKVIMAAPSSSKGAPSSKHQTIFASRQELPA